MADENTESMAEELPTANERRHYTDSIRRDHWKVLTSTEHRFGPRTIVVDEIESPDASRRLTWTYFRGRNAVMIVPLDEDDNVLLVREYRHPLRREVFNLPAGGAGPSDDEADLLHHAARELAEETCFSASHWIKLGSYHPIPSSSSVRFHIYVAKGLVPLEEKGTGDEWLEIEEVVRVPFSELHEAAVAGEIEDGTTLLALLWTAVKGLAPSSALPHRREA
jgi:8-oxo-dGTP pyrophosphatase MutT (NUDIX family)